MFKWLLENSLVHRLLVLIAAAVLMAYGAFTLSRTPVDVFPSPQTTTHPPPPHNPPPPPRGARRGGGAGEGGAPPPPPPGEPARPAGVVVYVGAGKHVH